MGYPYSLCTPNPQSIGRAPFGIISTNLKVVKKVSFKLIDSLFQQNFFVKNDKGANLIKHSFMYGNASVFPIALVGL